MDALDAVVGHAWHPSTPPFTTAIVNLSIAISAGVPQPGDPTVAMLEGKIRQLIGGVDAQGRPDPAGKRFLFVVAAANFATDRSTQCDAGGFVKQTPAILGTTIDGLVTVGGSTRDNEWWPGSCDGPAVEVAAPAENILVAATTGADHFRGPAPAGYGSGTSYATPYVSGIAARLLELHPNATPAELEARLKASPSRLADRDLPVPITAPPRKKTRAAAK
jgi:subtilisin family serine protease